MYPPADLAERVDANGEWYHSLDLAPGVVTPGWFDTRAVLDRIPFPHDLTGWRCLDVATFDGFWAFAMEARGAAEVVAIDLLDERQWDWPAGSAPETVDVLSRRKQRGAGFDVAREALGSSVERRELSVYDLDPDDIGTFDFVYLGSLLLHLQNPVGALEAVRRVCRGSLLVVDAIDIGLTVRHPQRPVGALDGRGRPWWWKPNRAGLVRMVDAAGFMAMAPPVHVLIPPGAGQHRMSNRDVLRSLRHRDGRDAVVRSRLGDPHLAVLARPDRSTLPDR